MPYVLTSCHKCKTTNSNHNFHFDVLFRKTQGSFQMPNRVLITRSMESSRGTIRYLSSGKGKILSEEERAAENVYIHRKERGILEKQKAEKVKAEKAKENADKKTDGTH